MEELLNCQNIRKKLSLATMRQVLWHSIVPIEHESDTHAKLVRCVLSFKTPEGAGIEADCIKSAYFQAIKVGRIKALAVFQELMMSHEDELDAMIQALQVAAENRHYPMVLHLINSIPSDKRLSLLLTKAVINDDMPCKGYWRVPDKTHVLQWAVCRSVSEDIQCILDALTEEERFTLITYMPDEDDFSPLLLAAFICLGDNLVLMLDSLTHKHAIEAILPKKVSVLSPLDVFHSYDHNRHETVIMPILLTKLFGENQKLYDAYHYLGVRPCGWKLLRALRDHYLATHFPSHTQKGLAFFGIGGNPLSDEELDVVVRVIFYQNYYKFDSIQRGEIEDRMHEYEHREEATLAARRTVLL